MKKIIWILLPVTILVLLAAAAFYIHCTPAEKVPPPPKMIYGIGFVRGIGQITLKNKFAGFVSKVNFFSQNRVKKGDIILEYDDLELRAKITEAQHEIAELLQEQQKMQLELALQSFTKIMPKSSMPISTKKMSVISWKDAPAVSAAASTPPRKAAITASRLMKSRKI